MREVGSTRSCDGARRRARRHPRPGGPAAILALLLLPGAAALAAELDELGSELMLFEDLPVVVTASRQSRPVQLSSAAVAVLTAEEIHQSGLTTIPELLQLLPGVDLLPIDRNRYAIGVRGFHDEFSERTLTLIDGRVADHPAIGGFESFRLPVFIEDIERIEVVRGPGGAAWGANAYTGVINIITKDPEKLAETVPDDRLGLLATATVTDHPDLDTQLRSVGSAGDLSWRVSGGYREHESSEDALDGADFDIFSPDPAVGALIGFDTYVARDDARDWRLDSDLRYRFDDETTLRAGIGLTDLRRGDREFVGDFQQRDEDLTTVRGFARIEHQLTEHWGASAQWYGSFERSDYSNIPRTDTDEHDLELQLDGTVAEAHALSLGGNVRWLSLDTRPSLSDSARFVGEPFHEQWIGLFAVDRWQMLERTALEVQARGDYYSEGEQKLDWSGRLSLFQALDAEQRHVVRLGAARAFRSPKASLRNGEGSFISLSPTGGEPYLFNVLVPDGLDNEETWSVEVGYHASPLEGLSLQLEGYYQRFEDLTGRAIAATEPVFVVVTENVDGADSFGAEIELSYVRDAGRLTVWYAYNDFETDRDEQNIRGYFPARHKVGARGRLDLPWELGLNVNYRFSDTTPVDGAQVTRSDAPSFHRLDLVLARAFLSERIEIAGGVRDVLNDERDPIFTISDLTAHEVVGRTFFARLQVAL